MPHPSGLFARGPRVLLIAVGVLASAAASAQTGTTYHLGPRDEITITVLRHPEFSGDYLVPPSGTIQIPTIGELAVTDLTLPDVQRKVADLMKVRLLRPDVTVKLKTARVDKASVLGVVKSPGAVEVKPGWGIAETLSAAGGLVAGVEQKDVRLTLEPVDGRERVQISLEDALRQTGDKAIKVAPDDVLRVETVANFPVYITGKVKTPGMYKLREDNTDLLAALAQAGGVTEEAALGNVKVVRASGKEEVVDLTPALVRGESTAKLPKLGGGDMVIVSESLSRFAVLGFVSKPGYFPLPQGRPFFLSDAVAQASGVDKRGRLSKVGVVRVENGKEVRKVYDLGKFLNKGDATQNPVVEAGDVVYVPESPRADNSTIISALGATAGFLNLFRRY